MTDKHGLKKAQELGITLGQVGHKVVLENDRIRVWELTLQPGERIDYHVHYHPYLVVSLGGGENLIETVFGDERKTHEPAGHIVYMNDARPVHRLTNKADVAYVSRLIEFKDETWTLEEAEAPKGETPPADAMAAFQEILIQTRDVDWVEKSLAGLSHKMLWRNEETGASIALVRFEKGAGIPEAHAHASNQLMFCLEGRYRYIPTGNTLTPGTFYCNPKGSVHGPTVADETSVMLEVYDGPHYPVRPSWYSNEEDAH
jgi:quercetin dioxygenase-like cupin family protein